MTNILTMHEHNSLNHKYLGIPFCDQLRIALYEFYLDKMLAHKKSAPNKHTFTFPTHYDPVLIALISFDPMYVGKNDCKLFEYPEEMQWKEWPDCNRIEKLEKFIDLLYNSLLKNCRNTHKEIFPLYKRNEYIMLEHFIFVKEMISHNSIIIGFYHLASKTYRRYLIKDVGKVIKTLSQYKKENIIYKRLENMVNEVYTTPILSEYARYIIDRFEFKNKTAEIIKIRRKTNGKTN